ncbi:MAG: pyruvate dehydrogenase (acetyl-transferring), homodimeric type [Legionellales bacterium]|nr:pyruvate dehydrogenase (acetyl-transferring), homodimeric type [Legionellales bacterium]|tara:strand:- start:31424 stop:34078 length:2655 start_codon:yes stop_codon:yes gene_type:complete
MSNTVTQDIDPQETREWLEALDAIIEDEGPERAQFLLQQLISGAGRKGLKAAGTTQTPYLNTLDNDLDYPGNLELEERLANMIRWNAAATVVKATKKASELGGHLSSYASACLLYEMGFNHFFHADDGKHGGDLLFIQGHSSPGIYARSFMEGRLSAEHLDGFRQEIQCDKSVSSYPHPWLMPDYWQFPTVSMGLGPMQAIYQARFLKYLHNRGLADTSGRKVWMFCGDGEMDEPESLGALSIAAREKLDNLIFVINCNLQRLDGPVRGNGKIIQELESIFRGNGWNVIKAIWGSEWDPLLAKDSNGILRQRMEEMLDGEYQYFHGKPGAEAREMFFGKSPELLKMVEHLSDAEIENLRYAGHDPVKMYTAYHAAVNHEGQPTVVLAKSIKGYGLISGQGQNTAHNTKKLDSEELKDLRNRFNVPISDSDAEKAGLCHPDPNSPEMQYLHERRKALGGYLPARRQKSQALTVPGLDAFANHLKGSGDREISTTMAYVRILSTILKDKQIGKHIVPIVPDESRTFGMEGLFRQIGIYSTEGQQYKPVDADQLMYYREDTKGQYMQEGINEAGGFCTWLAAGTAYSVSDCPMIPFYIYYSMFGFQRFGDFAWAAGDIRAKGFVIGGTAGRTTLAGEGLQHQDGNSHTQAGLIPNCVTYDPTFGYELAVIIQDGLRRMYHEQEDVFYYITVMNENYHHPDMPEGVEDGIVKGMYRFSEGEAGQHKVQLLGCGTILNEVIKAAEVLARDYNVSADVWSVTSFNELRKEAVDVERWNRLHPEATPRRSYITQCLDNTLGPVIAATDYVREFADQVRAFVPRPYTVLGTDGFGRSDTRKELREFFEVDSRHIVAATLKTLADEKAIPVTTVVEAMTALQIDPDKPNPATV